MSTVTYSGAATEVLEPEVQEREWTRETDLDNGDTGLGDIGTGNRRGDGRDGGDSGDGGNEPVAQSSPEPPGIRTNVLGMLVFIASEAVLFLTLIVTFALARTGYPEWPPPDQPMLPVMVSFINTLVLLGSGGAMFGAWRSMRLGRLLSCRRRLTAATLLGILFLVVQGVEWGRLIDFGLEVNQNLYGAVFYVIIGMHALHVFIAVLVLLYVLRRTCREAYTREEHDGLTMGGLFWGFVVLIWPVLFTFVYLL